MAETLVFADMEAFRNWLNDHGSGGEGAWLLFGKKGGPTTLSAREALEAALCVGWIDGQMQRRDDTTYRKYFAPRRPRSVWSETNRKLAQVLIDQGRMTAVGLEAIDQAKRAGTWDTPARTRIEEGDIEDFKLLVQQYEPAYTHLLAMPPSVHRTYTGFYLDAKSDKARSSRLERIVDRLNRNLKPM